MAGYFPFPPVDYPRLRPGVVVIPIQDSESAVVDGRHLVPGGVYISPAYRPILTLCDGRHSQAEIAQQSVVPPEKIREFLQALDRALLLDSPAFAAYLQSPQRLPACLGAYPREPEALRQSLAPLFPDGVPAIDPTAPRLRAMLVPHMDYARGGTVYGRGFAEIARRPAPEVVVVVATSHYSAERFSLTRKDYWTPLGTIPTDTEGVAHLEAHYGAGLYDDPYAHLPEHSIELELLLLQYLWPGREFRCVPLLVGSMHDTLDDHLQCPGDTSDIHRMIGALKSLDQKYGDQALWVISGDLAHIGPKFGDEGPLQEHQLKTSAAADQKILARLEAADPNGYFALWREEQDARRICGFAPTWLTLAALKPTRGLVHEYRQYQHPQGAESVSFAAVSFLA